jgi:hypothetical protein
MTGYALGDRGFIPHILATASRLTPDWRCPFTRRLKPPGREADHSSMELYLQAPLRLHGVVFNYILTFIEFCKVDGL